MIYIFPGTWFIQDVCQVIKEASAPITLTYWTIEVKKRVISRRGETNSESSEAVQLPRFNESITMNYVLPPYREVY